MPTLPISCQPKTHPGGLREVPVKGDHYTWRHNQAMRCLAATLEISITAFAVGAEQCGWKILSRVYPAEQAI